MHIDVSEVTNWERLTPTPALKTQFFLGKLQKTCSKSPHSNFVWKRCFLHILEACCVISSGDSQRGFSRLVRTWTASFVCRQNGMTMNHWNTSCFCLFTISATEGCVCIRNPNVQCTAVQCRTCHFLCNGLVFYLNLDFELQRKITYQHPLQSLSLSVIY